jgi:hypothetical protein
VKKLPAKIFRVVSRFPAIKRFMVNITYRFPALDARLRSTVHRMNHPEAELDVNAKRLPDSARLIFDRLRARQTR